MPLTSDESLVREANTDIHVPVKAAMEMMVFETTTGIPKGIDNGLSAALE